jgi:tripartite-type tricarboxylate transporter receptor subunit TctC
MQVRTRCACAIGAALGIAPLGSFAQQYPDRAIRLIIPFAPAGTNDIIGRVVAQKASEILGQTIVADNRAGAGGTIGSTLAARAQPDGYTLLLGHIGTLAVNPTLYRKPGYDPLKDFAPITLVAKLPNLMAVHPKLPAKTVAEFIALAKAKKGGLSYGSGGVGGAAHLATEYFRQQTGIDIVHVAYRGTGLAVIDVISGQLAMTMAGIPAIIPHVRNGNLRAIAVTGDRRFKLLPDVPTVAESGVPGFEATQWYGIVTQTGTPKAVVSTLHSAIVKAVQSPEVSDRLAADGAEPFTNTPEQFRAFIKAEIDRWAPIVREIGQQ